MSQTVCSQALISRKVSLARSGNMSVFTMLQWKCLSAAAPHVSAGDLQLYASSTRTLCTP